MIKVSQKLKDKVKLYPGKQWELAVKVGIHPGYLSQIVNDLTHIKNKNKKIMKLARILGLEENEIFEEEHN